MQQQKTMDAGQLIKMLDRQQRANWKALQKARKENGRLLGKIEGLQNKLASYK